MTVLDTFYILFKADTKEAEKAFDKINLGTNRIDSSLNRIARRWVSLYALITGLGRAMAHEIDLSQTAKELDVNVAALDVWGNAVRRTGGNVDTFAKTLDNLAERLNTTPKIALEVLPKLADQFEKLNRTQAIRYGKVLGLDMPTILMLQQGRRELDALIARQKELGFLTDKDAVVFRKFQEELQNTGHGFSSLVNQIAIAVIPYINKFLHAMQETTIYLRKHTGLIKGALIPIAAIFIGIAGSIALANIPLTIFIASVVGLAAAFALAYDDIQVFMQGGDSVIGRMLARWPALGDAARAALKGIKLAFEGIMWFFNDMAVGIEKVINAFRRLDQWFEPIFKKFHAALEFDASGVNLFSGKQAIAAATSNPIGSQNSNVFNTNRASKEVNLSINEIQIQTQATDATQIAYGLTNELNKQLRQTQNDIASGVYI